MQVEALTSESFLLATRIDRNAVDDDILPAPVESFYNGVDSTLLGTTCTTEGARFEDQQDSQIGSDVFYSELRVGDPVKVLFERIADGIADKVSFEHEALDGSSFSHLHTDQLWHGIMTASSPSGDLQCSVLLSASMHLLKLRLFLLLRLSIIFPAGQK